MDQVYIESLILEQSGEANLYNEFNSLQKLDLVQSTHDILGNYTFKDVKMNNNYIYTPRRNGN